MIQSIKFMSHFPPPNTLKCHKEYIASYCLYIHSPYEKSIALFLCWCKRVKSLPQTMNLGLETGNYKSKGC